MISKKITNRFRIRCKIYQVPKTLTMESLFITH